MFESVRKPFLIIEKIAVKVLSMLYSIWHINILNGLVEDTFETKRQGEMFNKSLISKFIGNNVIHTL